MTIPGIQYRIFLRNRQILESLTSHKELRGASLHTTHRTFSTQKSSLLLIQYISIEKILKCYDRTLVQRLRTEILPGTNSLKFTKSTVVGQYQT